LRFAQEIITKASSILAFVVNPDPRSSREGIAANMALYKYSQFVTKVDNQASDAIHEPEATAPNPGIYRCEKCGKEIATAAGHALPPLDHHQHTAEEGKIRWRLVVSHN
jgi:hypothetical protein